jgi:hypothetical protein
MNCHLSRHRFSRFFDVLRKMLRWFPSSDVVLCASHAALTIDIHHNETLHCKDHQLSSQDMQFTFNSEDQICVALVSSHGF